jgi:hypothetical protein
MQEPAMPIPGTTLQMGRDWFVQDVDGTRAFFHGGDTLGQHTDFFAFPAQNVVLVVLTNGQGGGSVASTAALNAALSQFPALASLSGKVGLMPALLAPADAPTISLSQDELAAYAGRYADPGMAMTISAKDEGLEIATETIIQPGAWLPAFLPPTPPPAPLAFLAEDLGVAAGGKVPFVRDADGEVQWVGAGLRLIPRV